MTKAELIKWLEDEIEMMSHPKEHLSNYGKGCLDVYRICLMKAKQLEEPKQ